MIACDVVLLPPSEIMEKSVEINRGFVDATGNTEIVLDKEKCIPHITLAMGCARKADLKKIDAVLKSIADDFPPIKLETIPIKEGGGASIKIEKNRDVELLHEIVMIRMSKFFTYNVSEKMLHNFPEEEIDEITLDYIKEFPRKSSFENYVPHITIGRGTLDVEVESFGFVCRKLALCHLGNFCTCREIIFSHDLSEKKK